MTMARIEIRASEADRAQWVGKAKAAGLTLSALIRQALNDAPMPRRRRRVAVDPALVRELARVGNNLNQLARWANRDRQAVEARAVIARLIEIDREIAVIRQAYEPGSSSRSAAPEAEDGAAKEKGDGDRTLAVAIVEAAIAATRADTGADIDQSDADWSGDGHE